MGTDASMFAMTSKVKLYFDRMRVIEKYWDMQHGEYDECSLTYDLLRNKRGCSYMKTLKFLELTALAWDKAGDTLKAEWARKLIDFVKAHPKDEFMVVTTSEEWDLPDADQYKEIDA